MLKRERKYFETHRGELLEKYPGKYSLIKNEELISTFDTLEDALSEGARLYGTESFLVRKIEETDEKIYIPALTLGILRADSTHPV